MLVDDDPLAAGIRSAVSEQAAAARWQLWEAVTRQPRSDTAWLWLAKVAESREEQQLCLDRAASLGRGPKRDLRLMPERAAVRSRGSGVETGRARALGRPGARLGNRAYRPPAAGACPVCERPWVVEPETCPRCRCRLDLGRVERFLEPSELTNRRVVREAIRGLAGRRKLGLDEHRALALAHLNLGELLDALAHLEVVSAESAETQARRAYETLRQHLDHIEVESGFETEVIERPTREELGLA